MITLRNFTETDAVQLQKNKYRHKTITEVQEMIREMNRKCYNDKCSFDIIYSSLTFMHIKDKQEAICKIATLLNENGRFVLSIDKNKSEYIDYGMRIIEIYPDDLDITKKCIEKSGLQVEKVIETELAYIIVATKNRCVSST